MQFNVPAFLESLNIMLTGMVGIFIVMMVIYGLIIGLGKVFSKKKARKAE